MRWSIWVALWLGAASAWIRPARAAWITGAGFLGLHVVLAFHLVHQWSHAAAVEATARQVESVVGFRSGEGLWINHLFLAGWTWVAWRWDALGQRARRLWWACFLFMGFNGAVVFVSGPARGFGIAWFLFSLVSAGRAWPVNRAATKPGATP